jgi:hypothetical protein
MRWAFQHINQLLDAAGCPLDWQAKPSRLHAKGLRLRRSGRFLQSGAKQLVHSLLQRLAGSPHLLFEEACYIIVDSQGCSHIMMFSLKTS